MKYKVVMRKRAAKALVNISEPYYSALKKAIYGLADDPRPQNCKKLRGRDAYRIRVADFRVIYEISDKIRVVDVIDLGHRRDIYT